MNQTIKDTIKKLDMKDWPFEVYIIRTIYAEQYVSYEQGTSKHIDCARTFYSQEEAIEYMTKYWNGTGEIIECLVFEDESVFFENGKAVKEQ